MQLRVKESMALCALARDLFWERSVSRFAMAGEYGG
jgi:hypothetical protein